MFIILGLLEIVWVLIWNRTFSNLPEENKYATIEELAIIRSN